MKEYTYTLRAKYYETDKMNVVHHSNYIRWMEDARTYFFDKAGYKVVQYEQAGVTSPVISVECEYKNPSTFDDEIGVDVVLEKYTGARITFSYVLTKIATGEIVATGKTSHCFTDAVTGLPIAVKKRLPVFDALLKDALNREI